MTLPHEEVNSLKITREFLYKLLIVKGTPKWIKDEARCCLRHYPIVIDDKHCSGKASKLDYKAKQPRHVT
jgi:hypothetical protein